MHLMNETDLFDGQEEMVEYNADHGWEERKRRISTSFHRHSLVEENRGSLVVPDAFELAQESLRLNRDSIIRSSSRSRRTVSTSVF